ncbi:hypothetical protein AKG34_13320 [Peribacillus butanolivorans]|uniref:hypothetical protein n=1 Tax=Peribacillus butanolivorans TaxID=421767 RepID=UPI0006A70CAC|nr:hypothetical protein [Peribacillus butanolivorans]KON69631.1 hypothetical protein AKG34_13320 [Peribacillus butanolivorans]
MEWLIQNREWVFSGIGIVVISAVARLFFKNKSSEKISQTIQSGDGSTNIQGVNNVSVSNGEKKDEK